AEPAGPVGAARTAASGAAYTSTTEAGGLSPRGSGATDQHSAQPIDDRPGCRAPAPDDSLPPVLPNGTAHPSPQPPLLEPCAEPESQAALASAHSSPPIRGPDLAEAPSPVQLSVLRV
ncbi:hypothetical protein AN216_21615, partial [Streptomyces oceani]